MESTEVRIAGFGGQGVVLAGVLLGGAATGPADLPTEVTRALAAAGCALACLGLNATLDSDPHAVRVHAERCAGCACCVSACSFGAITFDPIRSTAFVDAALCRGCGACIPTCGARALSSPGFTDEELILEIEALLAAPGDGEILGD